jgi:catechol 2,3-dioxygenase-like lactoylglutathione lyase family enzyme
MEFRISQKRNPVFEVKGFSHVALVCADMQRTIDFYQGVLGFPLIKTTEIPNGGGQHFFFDVGDGVNSLAFFYFPKKHVAEPGVTVPRNNVGDPSTAFDHDAYTTAIGSLNHLAFNVAPEMIPRYKEKLESLGIWVSPIMYHYKETATLGVELKGETVFNSSSVRGGVPSKMMMSPIRQPRVKMPHLLSTNTQIPGRSRASRSAVRHGAFRLSFATIPSSRGRCSVDRSVRAARETRRPTVAPAWLRC